MTIVVGSTLVTDDLASFDANDVILPAASAASVSSRNAHPILAFEDTSNEIGIFSGYMSKNYDPNRLLVVSLFWAAATAVVGDVQWDVAFEAIAPGVQDIDSDSFAADRSATETTDGTSGVLVQTDITFTQAQADAIAAQDPFRLRVTRNAAADTMVGDAQLLRVALSRS